MAIHPYTMQLDRGAGTGFGRNGGGGGSDNDAQPTIQVEMLAGEDMDGLSEAVVQVS